MKQLKKEKIGSNSRSATNQAIDLEKILNYLKFNTFMYKIWEITPVSNWNTNEIRQVDAFENAYAIKNVIDYKNDEKEGKGKGEILGKVLFSILWFLISSEHISFFFLVIKTLKS